MQYFAYYIELRVPFADRTLLSPPSVRLRRSANRDADQRSDIDLFVVFDS